jgi:hypothetical protein
LTTCSGSWRTGMNSQGFDSRLVGDFRRLPDQMHASKYFYGTFLMLRKRRICGGSMAKDSQNDPEIPARSPHRAACMAGAPFADND